MTTDQSVDLPKLTDEELQRINMTRARWEELNASRRERESRAPVVGRLAPDFELHCLGESTGPVKLSAFRGKRPVALIFGSYT